CQFKKTIFFIEYFFIFVVTFKLYNMKKISINLIAHLCLIFTFSSCLTYEKKETTVKFEGKNRGTLTVKYTDIRSSFSPDEGTSINEQTLADYQSLIDDYLKGDKLMEDFPHAEIQSKRL